MALLEQVLREYGVETVDTAGIATNFGAEPTARRPVACGFHGLVAEDARSSLDTAAHEFAMNRPSP